MRSRLSGTTQPVGLPLPAVSNVTILALWVQARVAGMGLGPSEEQEAEVEQLREELAIMRQRLDNNPEVKRFAGALPAQHACRSTQTHSMVTRPRHDHQLCSQSTSVPDCL